MVNTVSQYIVYMKFWLGLGKILTTSHVGKLNWDFAVNAAKYDSDNISLVGYLTILSILRLYSVRKLVLIQQYNQSKSAPQINDIICCTTSSSENTNLLYIIYKMSTVQLSLCIFHLCGLRILSVAQIK
jgi:hypothetical protein